MSYEMPKRYKKNDPHDDNGEHKRNLKCRNKSNEKKSAAGTTETPKNREPKDVQNSKENRHHKHKPEDKNKKYDNLEKQATKRKKSSEPEHINAKDIEPTEKSRSRRSKDRRETVFSNIENYLKSLSSRPTETQNRRSRSSEHYNSKYKNKHDLRREKTIHVDNHLRTQLKKDHQEKENRKPTVQSKNDRKSKRKDSDDKELFYCQVEQTNPFQPTNRESEVTPSHHIKKHTGKRCLLECNKVHVKYTPNKVVHEKYKETSENIETRKYRIPPELMRVHKRKKSGTTFVDEFQTMPLFVVKSPSIHHRRRSSKKISEEVRSRPRRKASCTDSKDYSNSSQNRFQEKIEDDLKKHFIKIQKLIDRKLETILHANSSIIKLKEAASRNTANPITKKETREKSLRRSNPEKEKKNYKNREDIETSHRHRDSRTREICERKPPKSRHRETSEHQNAHETAETGGDIDAQRCGNSPGKRHHQGHSSSKTKKLEVPQRLMSPVESIEKNELPPPEKHEEPQHSISRKEQPALTSDSPTNRKLEEVERPKDNDESKPVVSKRERKHKARVPEVAVQEITIPKEECNSFRVEGIEPPNSEGGKTMRNEKIRKLECKTVSIIGIPSQIKEYPKQATALEEALERKKKTNHFQLYYKYSVDRNNGQPSEDKNGSESFKMISDHSNLETLKKELKHEPTDEVLLQKGQNKPRLEYVKSMSTKPVEDFMPKRIECFYKTEKMPEVQCKYFKALLSSSSECIIKSKDERRDNGRFTLKSESKHKPPDEAAMQRDFSTGQKFVTQNNGLYKHRLDSEKMPKGMRTKPVEDCMPKRIEYFYKAENTPKMQCKYFKALRSSSSESSIKPKKGHGDTSRYTENIVKSAERKQPRKFDYESESVAKEYHYNPIYSLPDPLNQYDYVYKNLNYRQSNLASKSDVNLSHNSLIPMKTPTETDNFSSLEYLPRRDTILDESIFYNSPSTPRKGSLFPEQKAYHQHTKLSSDEYEGKIEELLNRNIFAPKKLDNFSKHWYSPIVFGTNIYEKIKQKPGFQQRLFDDTNYWNGTERNMVTLVDKEVFSEPHDNDKGDSKVQESDLKRKLDKFTVFSFENISKIQNFSTSKRGAPVDRKTQKCDTRDVDTETKSVEKAFVEKSPNKEVAVERSSIKEVVVGRTPTKEVAVEKNSAKEVVVGRTTTRDVAVEKNSTKEVVVVGRTPTREVAVERNSTKEVVVGRTPTKEVAVEKNSTKEVVVGRTTTREVAVEKNSTKEVVVVGRTPTREVAVEINSTKEVVVGRTPTKEVAVVEQMTKIPKVDKGMNVKQTNNERSEVVVEEVCKVIQPKKRGKEKSILSQKRSELVKPMPIPLKNLGNTKPATPEKIKECDEKMERFVEKAVGTEKRNSGSKVPIRKPKFSKGPNDACDDKVDKNCVDGDEAPIHNYEKNHRTDGRSNKRSATADTFPTRQKREAKWHNSLGGNYDKLNSLKKSQSEISFRKLSSNTEESRITSLVCMEKFLNDVKCDVSSKSNTQSLDRYFGKSASSEAHTSTFFLTKDFKTAEVSSYHKRKMYDEAIRRKMRKRGKVQNKSLAPQVFEVRFLTVDNFQSRPTEHLIGRQERCSSGGLEQYMDTFEYPIKKVSIFSQKQTSFLNDREISDLELKDFLCPTSGEQLTQTIIETKILDLCKEMFPTQSLFAAQSKFFMSDNRSLSFISSCEFCESRPNFANFVDCLCKSLMPPSTDGHEKHSCDIIDIFDDRSNEENCVSQINEESAELKASDTNVSLKTNLVMIGHESCPILKSQNSFGYLYQSGSDENQRPKRPEDTILGFSLKSDTQLLEQPDTSGKSCLGDVDESLSSNESGYGSSTRNVSSVSNFFRRPQIAALLRPLSEIELSATTSRYHHWDSHVKTTAHLRMMEKCQEYAKKVMAQSQTKIDVHEVYEEIPLDILLSKANLLDTKAFGSEPCFLQNNMQLGSYSEPVMNRDGALPPSTSDAKLMDQIGEHELSLIYENWKADEAVGKDGLKFSKLTLSSETVSTMDPIVEEDFAQKISTSEFVISNINLGSHCITVLESTDHENDTLLSFLENSAKSQYDVRYSSYNQVKLRRMVAKKFFENLLEVYEKQNVFSSALMENGFYENDLLLSIIPSKKDQKKYGRKLRKSSVGNRMIKFLAKKIFHSKGSQDSTVDKSMEEESQAKTVDDYWRDSLQSLAHSARKYFSMYVQAVRVNRKINDEMKICGFQKLLEMIEQGNLKFLRSSEKIDFEIEMRAQAKQAFRDMYLKALEGARKNHRTLTVDDLKLIGAFVCKYRIGLLSNADLICSCIGRGCFKTEDQLKGAVMYLMKNFNIRLEEFEEYCEKCT